MSTPSGPVRRAEEAEDPPRQRLRDVRMVPVAITAWSVALLVSFVPGVAGAVPVVSVVVVVGLVLLRIAVTRRGPRDPDPPGRVLRVLAGAAPLAVVCLAVAAAIGATAGLSAGARDEAAALQGHAVTAEVSVRSLPSVGADGRLWADADTLRLGPGKEPRRLRVPVRIGVPADARSTTLGPGTVLRLTAQTKGTDPGERAALVLFAQGEVEHLSRGGPIEVLAGDVRAAFIARSQRLPEPGSELLPGLAVGDVRAVSPDLDTAMKASGLSHLTAVSGSNLALVAGAGFGVVALLGGGRRIRVLVAATALAGFVVLVTPQPSVVRAAAMAGVAMLALLLGRPRAGLSVLLLAVTVLLLADPRLAAAPGFALSAAATAGLIVLAPPLARGLARWVPQPVALAIAVPLSAQLACGPIIALFAAQQSVVAVLANLLAEPASPIATVLGLFACLAMPIPPLADLFAAAAWLPSAWIAQTATTTAALPLATIEAPAGIGTALVVTAVSAAVFWLIVPHPPLRPWLRVPAGGLIAVAVGAAGGWAVLAGPVTLLQRPSDWSIAACDVGQGDAVLVRSAGRTMLIDTGPDPDPLRRCLDGLGIARLDVLLLTHFDKDHAGAADALIGGADVVLHGPPGTASHERLLGRLRAGGSRVVDAAAGMTGRLGGADWRVLWPRRDERVFPPGNDVGVIVEVEGGGVPRSVFLADLSAASQGMLRRIAHPHAYAVVKVAHHGSADQDPQLYADLRPALALISVGAGNDYGHPRQKTLDLLRSLRTPILRTDRRGTILVGQHDGSLRIWTERPDPGPDRSPRPSASARAP
ncbi:ComEC/Rec2 family competence protein [Microbacterium sp. ASV81]|uniref:ComEC/Rec2 family competence protein n=1 Tax=Microbacterium capsulatum TaxID=3041921 RepID=A0ABU0XDF2_9MICO|nr:ComEC/Rec2 family competence protein [Microbacterium sp. ASV81]MDQ4213137.1 ComEC/Rec2 family competence protein [Microbacterium sp. ASV81]